MSNAFNSFYHDVKFLSEPDEAKKQGKKASSKKDKSFAKKDNKQAKQKKDKKKKK